MTPPKIWYAKKLASLRDDNSDPEAFVKTMTISRMCYEIEKIEDEIEAKAAKEAAKAVPKKKKEKEPKSFWSYLVGDDSDLEE
jgi:hypothetical protein